MDAVPYPTRAAILRYADWAGLRYEEARRELTELLCEARVQRGASPDGEIPETWRYRRRSTGVDLTATVSREGPLAVVVAVEVREYRGSRRGGKRHRGD